MSLAGCSSSDKDCFVVINMNIGMDGPLRLEVRGNQVATFNKELLNGLEERGIERINFIIGDGNYYFQEFDVMIFRFETMEGNPSLGSRIAVRLSDLPIPSSVNVVRMRD
ncbi:MAG: hypothetical protein FWE36_00405 [Erysipelotrichales bacterium]|nr:hypothetical protein [Erysipelotrichales bacterium]